MCTSPILIRNKRLRSLSVDIPNSFVKVPCGQCEECLRKRSKDLYIRARFECEKCFEHGGCGFMCALTYDNETLPLLQYEGKSFMVFNKQHLIDFIKRLRTRLDRFFKKHYNTIAPDFKYLVTSEFGSDPTRTHRPHYHLIILFDCQVSLFVFRKCFFESLSNQKTGKRYFGKIFQCDILDIKRGGIKYSCKYILKDQTYNSQYDIIHRLIDFETDRINSQFGIIQLPHFQNDFFLNKCIRSSKAYKKAVETSVKKYRHMLQFYMCSNDFGCSAIIDKYGDSLFSLGVLNIDFLPYSIPKSVFMKLERDYGTESRDRLVKSVFMSRFRQIVDDSVFNNYISQPYGEKLYYFAAHFLQPRYGCLYFVHPFNLSFANRFFDIPLFIDDTILEEFRFYDDNNFFDLRNAVISVINMSNTSDKLEFRAKVARSRSQKEREEYDKKKRNNPSFY